MLSGPNQKPDARGQVCPNSLYRHFDEPIHVSAVMSQMDSLYHGTFCAWVREEGNRQKYLAIMKRISQDPAISPIRIVGALEWLCKGWSLDSLGELLAGMAVDWPSSAPDGDGLVIIGSDGSQTDPTPSTSPSTDASMDVALPSTSDVTMDLDLPSLMGEGSTSPISPSDEATGVYSVTDTTPWYYTTKNMDRLAAVVLGLASSWEHEVQGHCGRLARLCAILLRSFPPTTSLTRQQHFLHSLTLHYSFSAISTLLLDLSKYSSGSSGALIYHSVRIALLRQASARTVPSTMVREDFLTSRSSYVGIRMKRRRGGLGLSGGRSLTMGTAVRGEGVTSVRASTLAGMH